jgi:hypothetical protein
MDRAAADDNKIGAGSPLGIDPGCGDVPMRIARDGTWFYQGSPIGRKPLVKLFSTVLRRERDGSFWLVTPVERCRIAVDDAPFVAVEMRVSGSGQARSLRFRTNVDDEITAGPAHPIRVAMNPTTGEPSPYVLVRGDLEALIARAVFYDLVELAEPALVGGRDTLGVWSDGAFFALGAP